MQVAKNTELYQSFKAAQDITRYHAKSFYFASIVLPKKKKFAAYAVYAFCRYVDDCVDKTVGDKTKMQSHLREKLEQLYSSHLPIELSWARAFHQTVHVYQIPQTYFEELIHGVLLDAKPSVAIQTWAELREYCYYVASVVGLIMCCIFGLRENQAKEQAIALGLAMQLTNILRDVKEDYFMNRVYLPKEELIAYQVNLKDGFQTSFWKKYAAFFIQRARSFYNESEKGIAFLSCGSSQFTVWLMRWIYAAILDEIESHHYDVSSRHRVNFFKKVRLVFKAYSSYKKVSCDSSQ